MLCRTSKLVHPASGVSLKTPLLVPSFSSKAFGFECGGEPEVARVLDVSRDYITKTCLVSAYDIHYKYVPQPQDFVGMVDLLFLDSGGYEVSDAHDLSTIEIPVYRPREWNPENLGTIWNCWPDDIPTVFVSYDHSNCRKPVLQQLQDATRAALSRPGHLHTFLLKPQTHAEYDLESALQVIQYQVEKLNDFQLIGVTEKELGNSLLERMIRIARLRRALDKASVDIPIHVFGTLDPLSISLYFVAGAEVFDGLTWSRHAYVSGRCIYIHNNAAIEYGLDICINEARVRTIRDNLLYLTQLERSLRRMAEEWDWNYLVDNREFVQRAAKRMAHELEECM